MIITNKVEMTIYKNSKNKNYYKNKGYIIDNSNKIYVDVKDLPESSTFKIIVKCDICGTEKEIEYRHYLKNIKNQNYFACSKICSNDKYKKTCLEKYGYDNPLKSPKIKEQIKETNIEKYGYENPFSNETIKQQIETTNLNKYGCKRPLQNDNIKEKIKKTCLEKYGVDSYSKTDECKDKVKTTNICRYGVGCSLHNNDIMIKVTNNNLLKIWC